jgi:hypothetical protein
MVVRVTVAVVQLILARPVWPMVSGTLSWTGIVVSDVVATCWGGFLPTRHAVVVWSEHAWRGAPLGGTTRRGDVYENGLGMPPLRRALSLLHRRSFQQVSQLLMDVLSLIGRGLRQCRP